MKETKLLPCPFCGADGEFYQNTRSDEINCGVDAWTWTARCSKCSVSSPTDNHKAKEEAAESWNRRASPWQDIASAPKDGTQVWVSDRGIQCAARYSHSSKHWHDSSVGCVIPNPTHWMPLPQPPK